MPFVTTLLATGVLFAATAMSQSAASASSSSSTTTTTTTTGLLGAEASIPTGANEVGVAANAASANAAASLGGPSGASIYEPLPTSTGITHTIDGTLYVPATMCVDYQNYTESSSWSPSNPTSYSSIIVDPLPSSNPIPPGGYPTGGTTMQTTSSSTGGVSIPTGEIPPPSSSAIANVQLSSSQNGDEARQFDIPTDNTLTPILRRGFKADELTVVSADDEAVTCQAFNDKAGRVKLGKAVKVGKTGDVTKDGEEVRVRAVKCGTVVGAAPVV